MSCAVNSFDSTKRRHELRSGKFLGAVGTGAAQGVNARELQRLILTHLGLGVPLATTQVVGRDRYIEYVSWLAEHRRNMRENSSRGTKPPAVRNPGSREKASMSKSKLAPQRWPTRRTRSSPKTPQASLVSFAQ